MLSGGDRRSLGRAEEVLALVTRQTQRLPELVECLWADDPANDPENDAVVRMRAADVLEKLSRANPAALIPFKRQLLTLMAETTQKEVRWHLALMVPRLRLTPSERLRASEQLHAYLDDHSSIVKTHAMQGLADLSIQHPPMRPAVMDLLRALSRTGTPAMRARARLLLGRMKQS